MSKVLVCPLGEKSLPSSLSFADKLRKENVNVEIYPEYEAKLEKQLKFANRKGVPFVAILGEEESGKGKVTLKNMKTGEQELLDGGETVDRLRG